MVNNLYEGTPNHTYTLTFLFVPFLQANPYLPWCWHSFGSVVASTNTGVQWHSEQLALWAAHTCFEQTRWFSGMFWLLMARPELLNQVSSTAVNIWGKSLCLMNATDLAVQSVCLRMNPLLESRGELLLFLEPPAIKEMSRVRSEFQTNPLCIFCAQPRISVRCILWMEVSFGAHVGGCCHAPGLDHSSTSPWLQQSSVVLCPNFQLFHTQSWHIRVQCELVKPWEAVVRAVGRAVWCHRLGAAGSGADTESSQVVWDVGAFWTTPSTTPGNFTVHNSKMQSYF